LNTVFEIQKDPQKHLWLLFKRKTFSFEILNQNFKSEVPNEYESMVILILKTWDVTKSIVCFELIEKYSKVVFSLSLME
jgi:hypothetical protein